MHDTAEPVYLVVDGHPTHRSNLVKEFVASTGGRCARSYYPLTPPTLGPHPPAVSERSGRSTPVLAVPTPGPRRRHSPDRGQIATPTIRGSALSQPGRRPSPPPPHRRRGRGPARSAPDKRGRFDPPKPAPTYLPP